ncbi:MAG: sulfotransferase [Flavobacteriaceae bacterium]|nr:sulfotransferase [Flavobacteriaceae bacterium]
MKNLLKNLLCSVWKTLFQKKNQKHLFLMGHPRSGSSLLMHILTSNNEIAGFGEYLIKYNDSKSFDLAEFDIKRKSKSLFKSIKWVANQVNHHSITPEIELLNSKDIKLIILLRKPEETLSSIFLLAERKQKPMSQNDITKMYVERLNYFSLLINKVDRSQWLFLTYESLLSEKEIALKKLSDFLEIKEMLSPKYQLKQYTQVWGDPSENIKKGAIFKTNSKQIPWDKKLLEEANKVYENTISNLLHF